MTSGYSAPGSSRWNQKNADWAWNPYEAGPPLFAPGTAFAYWDEAQMMFGRLLTIVAGQNLESILKTRIAGPIGIVAFRWNTEGDYQGIPINNGCTGLNLSASQLARFGLLFLNNGSWDGRQLVPPGWVRQATTTQVPSSLPVAPTDRSSTKGSGNYGYNWWTNGEVRPGIRALPDAPAGMYYSSGFNNNMCFIVPEWNLVFVRTGMDGNPAKGKKVVYNEFFRRLESAILR
jgi:CubicO group peptidase (beta-lactamase class C family)